MSEEKIQIQSNRLSVDLAQPGTIYRGTRFDWTGFVTQVTLDGSHTFCIAESLVEGQGTGGIGLCNEFGYDMPIGFRGAQPADGFPKLGIGLLQRGDQKEYNFFKPYPILQQFPIQVALAADAVIFTVEPLETRGYAARLVKKVSVHENWLEIHSRLENTGKEPITTNEYYHNFMAIDEKRIGPEYRLSFAQPVEFEDTSHLMRSFVPWWMRILPKGLVNRVVGMSVTQMESILAVKDNGVTWERNPSGPFYVRLKNLAKTEAPQWELLHQPSGVGMREVDDFAPMRLAVWGVEHVVSAEVFVLIEVAPGASFEWTRRYEFFHG